MAGCSAVFVESNFSAEQIESCIGMSPPQVNTIFTVHWLKLVIRCLCTVPLEKKGVLPPPLSDLFKELVQKCEDVFNTLSVIPMQAKKVEEHTRGQLQSETWFGQRAARITASKFKASTLHNHHSPSTSSPLKQGVHS